MHVNKINTKRIKTVAWWNYGQCKASNWQTIDNFRTNAAMTLLHNDLGQVAHTSAPPKLQ